MTPVLEDLAPYRADLDAVAAALPGRGRTWLDALRAAGREAFLSVGFPTSRLEDWKYTDLRELVRKPLALGGTIPDASVVRELLAPVPAASDEIRIVLVNGTWSEEFSDLRRLPAGVSVESLAAAMARGAEGLEGRLGTLAPVTGRPLSALSTALLRDGVFLQVADGVRLEEPIHLVHLSQGGGDGAAFHPRHLLVLGAGSRTRVIESCVGGSAGRYLTNTVTEADVAAGAVLEHLGVQDESQDAWHVSRLAVRLAREAHLRACHGAFGARVSRDELDVLLAEPGSSCDLAGVYAAGGSRLADTQVLVDHAAPDCRSKQTYRGIVSGRATGVFTGRVIVRAGSDGTDAAQDSKSLLLSPDAQADTRPQLEIYADDVKCSHGTTTGQLDATSLFYLRSRGIACDEARQMLTRAFAATVILSLEEGSVRDHLAALLDRNLENGDVT